MRKNSGTTDANGFIAVKGKLYEERSRAALERVKSVLPDFRFGEQVKLAELDRFLRIKYKAERADWKDIDKCTRTKVKRYNRFCKDVFCVSEAHVTNEEYRVAYIVKRENCVRPSTDKDDFYYDMFVIVGSEYGERLSSYYIGGYSEGFADEMFVLCGNK